MDEQVKKVFIVFSVVIVVLIGTLGYVIYDYNDKLTSLESDIASRAQLVDASLQTVSEQSTEGDQQLASSVRNVDGKLTNVSMILSEAIDELSAATSANIESLQGKIQDVEESSQESISELQSSIANLDGDFSSFIEDLYPAIVSVQTNTGQGSGFFVEENGYIATNYHVVEGATAASVVTSDGESHGPVSLIGFDAEHDIAVLKIDGDDFMVLDFENRNDIKVGQKIVAIGNPLGLSFSLTQGVISALDREIQGSPVNFIQTDTPINPGNSGGPMINADRKIVGMATAIIEGSQSIGFAIPADEVEDIVDDIIADFEAEQAQQ